MTHDANEVSKLMPRARQADIAVIGAVMVGLAHAYEAAWRCLSVVLFEARALVRL